MWYIVKLRSYLLQEDNKISLTILRVIWKNNKFQTFFITVVLIFSNRMPSIAFSRNLINSGSVIFVPIQHELFQYLYLFRRFKWVIILFSFFIISSSMQCLQKQYNTKMLPAKRKILFRVVKSEL